MRVHTVVIGTGFSGLGMAIQLKRDGRDDFVVLEKAGDVGGTWRDNTYPGCACDVPSHMYSFSFEQNPDWSRTFSPQPEIWDYLRAGRRQATGCGDHIRFGTEVTGARWDADEHRWHVTHRAGRRVRRAVPRVRASARCTSRTSRRCRASRTSRARRSTPRAGTTTTTWPASGSPWSAPARARSSSSRRSRRQVGRADVFQRTPPWIMPKPDHAIPGWAKRVFRAVPGAQRLLPRRHLLAARVARGSGSTGSPALMKLAQGIALRHMEQGRSPDPELRRKLTPDYIMGCKRVLDRQRLLPGADAGTTSRWSRTASRRCARTVDRRQRRASSTRSTRSSTAPASTSPTRSTTSTSPVRTGATWRRTGAPTGSRPTRDHGRRATRTCSSCSGRTPALGHNSVVFMIESQIRYVLAGDARWWTAGRGGAGRRGRARRHGSTADIQRKLVDGRVDPGRLQELVPRRPGREPHYLAGLHLAILAAHPPPGSGRLRAGPLTRPARAASPQSSGSWREPAILRSRAISSTVSMPHSSAIRSSAEMSRLDLRRRGAVVLRQLALRPAAQRQQLRLGRRGRPCAGRCGCGRPGSR